MAVIVTMAGIGSRFRVKGYQVPKFMIRAKGKSLFNWSMDSLAKFFDQHFIFACLSEHDSDWIKSRAHEIGISRASVLSRSTVSLGQAQTAFDVLNEVDNDEEFWIYNIDTYIEQGMSPSDLNGFQGCAHVFNSKNGGMSFVRYDTNGRAIEIAEKKVISNWATVGMYGFESGKLYRELYEEAYLSGKVQEFGGERYVAPMYQLLLAQGYAVNAPQLSLDKVHILGTPEEVLAFDPSALPPFGKF